MTISAEMIFFMHFTDRLDTDRQQKIVNYLIYMQREDGVGRFFMVGCVISILPLNLIWPLKLQAFLPTQKAMVRARNAIHKNGGIKKTRVFTKIFLAMFGQISGKFAQPSQWK
ncbi:MAG: hypothetical protein CM1200mP16_05410 [Nitrospina sp.]|nr:MAG: hypothetical protein CM1200mP16_05410 [Nitrospina sp.]